MAWSCFSRSSGNSDGKSSSSGPSISLRAASPLTAGPVTAFPTRANHSSALPLQRSGAAQGREIPVPQAHPVPHSQDHDGDATGAHSGSNSSTPGWFFKALPLADGCNDHLKPSGVRSERPQSHKRQLQGIRAPGWNFPGMKQLQMMLPSLHAKKPALDGRVYRKHMSKE